MSDFFKKIADAFSSNPLSFAASFIALLGAILSPFGIIPWQFLLSAIFGVLLTITIRDVESRITASNKDSCVESTREHLESVDSSIKSILDLIDGQAFRYFDSGEKAHRYFETLLSDATEVWHASVGPSYSVSRPSYKDTFNNALKKEIERGLAYRYITCIYSNEKAERINKLLSDELSSEIAVGYYDLYDDSPPTIYFMIADCSQVLVRCPHEIGEKDEYYVFSNKSIVGLFRKYHFILWNNSKHVSRNGSVSKKVKSHKLSKRKQ